MENKKSAILITVAISVIVVFVILTYSGFFAFFMPFGFMFFSFALLVPLAGVMIYVCIKRIKEIEREDEDDLSKY